MSTTPLARPNLKFLEGPRANDSRRSRRCGAGIGRTSFPFFAYPLEVRKMIYTTNAIESLNAKLRRRRQ
jgi:hypothetical protein